MILLLVMVFIGIALLTIPDLVKKKHWRELIVYVFFFLAAFGLTLLHVIGIKLPTIAQGMEYLVKDLLHLNIYQ